MATIALISTQKYVKGYTTKYWRDIICDPQTVELRTWGNNSPLFVLKGKVCASHDSRELGKEMEVFLQMYDFELNQRISEGIYIINN